MTNVHVIVHPANTYLCSLPSPGCVVVPAPMAFQVPGLRSSRRRVGVGTTLGGLAVRTCLGLRRPGQLSFVSAAFGGKQTPWGRQSNC